MGIAAQSIYVHVFSAAAHARKESHLVYFRELDPFLLCAVATNGRNVEHAVPELNEGPPASKSSKIPFVMLFLKTAPSFTGHTSVGTFKGLDRVGQSCASH